MKVDYVWVMVFLVFIALVFFDLTWFFDLRHSCSSGGLCSIMDVTLAVISIFYISIGIKLISDSIHRKKLNEDTGIYSAKTIKKLNSDLNKKLD